MNPSKDFKQINFHPFNFFNDRDQQDMRDPDLNCFNDLNSNNFDSPYVLEENVKRYLCDIKRYGKLALIHVNVRSMNSNFEKLLLLNCLHSFNIICVTKIWSTDNDIKNNLNFYLSNFAFIHQERKTGKKGGGILIYVKSHIKFKIRKYLSVSDGDSECVTAEIENKNSKKNYNYMLLQTANWCY